MKTSVWAACVVAALCANTAFATPSQDKPVTKTTTTTTVKKTTPVKSKTMTKSVHKKHVKQSTE
ncbi:MULTISPECIES: hypothetical protein [unclassified Spirosoma]|uniref:hypothetical protein n=1 Tax=unclassified Spirosoma TaxID=2621999 RepID=UPI00095C6C25|nr:MULTISPECIES: hypothetical protein [unclassified Spirosoma]MBN8821178.1 hypothetical protein [Spirosoma sp.]OJW79191.1 MAG: hypothetical protein BGO59_11635 [Spirosoma sp. 48-14]